ncbi:hypothetical protein Salat_1233000 [Sesamum alatum]|uniref:Uncharacterized protein n=1 Tax=Sesamum alatum TaxID=300844 RepID=A0AAE1YFH2_9LAMI|nr:hypothetical protein Salat_1233000 [Sesamum alatum]
MNEGCEMEFTCFTSEAPLFDECKHHNVVQQIRRQDECILLELHHRRVGSERRLRRSPQGVLLYAQVRPQTQPFNFSLRDKVVLCPLRPCIRKASPPASIRLWLWF